MKRHANYVGWVRRPKRAQDARHHADHASLEACHRADGAVNHQRTFGLERLVGFARGSTHPTNASDEVIA